EFGANAAIRTNGAGHLVYIGSGNFTEFRNGIDGGYALVQEGVSRQLGKLRRPQVCRQDFIGRYPRGVNVDERLYGLLVFATNEDPVRMVQVSDGGAFGQEFGIGEDMEINAVARIVEDALQRFGRTHR